MELSNRISVLYWNYDLFTQRIFKSDGYLLDHHFLTTDYDFEQDTQIIRVPDGLHQNIIILNESHSNIEKLLEGIYRKVSQPNIVYFVHSVEKNIFDGRDNDREWKYIEKWSKRISKMVSFHYRHPVFKYDPTLWLDSFRKDIPDFFGWFDKKGLPFITSHARFGLHIHRVSFARERLILFKELEGRIFNYPTYITCRSDDITNQAHTLSERTMKYYEFIKNHIFPEDFSHSNKERWWEENYRIWSSSLIEIVIETFISTPYCLGWDEKYTEKTLRPILGCKPFMFLDPFSYKLFKDMGFWTYDSLMGKRLKELYDGWDKPRGDYSYVKPFVDRLEELANMDEGAFERVYEDSLPIAIKNREILDSWKFYYEDCERWFELPYIKKEEKVKEITNEVLPKEAAVSTGLDMIQKVKKISSVSGIRRR